MLAVPADSDLAYSRHTQGSANPTSAQFARTRLEQFGGRFTRRLRDEEMQNETQMPDHEEFAKQWQILMKGSIVAAHAGDLDAAGRTKAAGALLPARNRIDARPGAHK
jgi:hypothetical protein